MRYQPNKISSTLSVFAINLHGPISSHSCEELQSRKGHFMAEENLIFYIRDGAVVLRHGETMYHAGKDHVLFIRKGILVNFEFQQGPAEWTTFVLTSNLIVEFARQTQLNTRLKEEALNIVATETDKIWTHYIGSIEPYLHQQIREESLWRLKSLELLFFLSFSNPFLLHQLLAGRENFRPDISQVVEENLSTRVSLSHLARKAGRSVSSFRRDFLSIYNMPPSKWIRQRRLEKAQEMLSATNMSVSSICYELGFESIAHFSRIFKSRFGCPPSESRMSKVATSGFSNNE